MIRYIHLNPVRARLVDAPEAYPYSGHRAYLIGDGRGLIDPGPVLNLLGGHAAYRQFVLAEIGAAHEDRYYQTEDQRFLGAGLFAREIGQHTPQHACTPPREPLDTVVRNLASRLALDPHTLRSPDRSRTVTSARAALSFVLVRRLGYRVADVAAALDRAAATISGIVSRLEDRLESSDGAAADVARLDRGMYGSAGLTPR